MKKHLLLTLSILFLQNSYGQTDNTIDQKRQVNAQKYHELKSKFESLDKKKIFGNKRVPPNEFNKYDYLNTIDPVTGTIPTQSILNLQRRLKSAEFSPDINRRISFLTNENPLNTWVERGPYKVGGRVRAIMFDPNDLNGKKVFAAGVTGGLWVNNDYSDVNSEWNPVDDFMSNTSIVSLAYDPNNPQIMYASTGEAQTYDLLGQGIFKSTDGGLTWSNYYFPAPTLDSNSSTNYGIYFVNNVVVRNNNGTSELYFGVSDGYFEDYYTGLNYTGLYKAVGNNIPTKIATNSIGDFAIEEIKIASDNTIWVSTRGNLYQQGGGRIYKSNDGINFTLVYNSNLPTSRVVLGVSATNPNKVYALLQGGRNEPVRLIKTTNAGQSWTSSATSNSGVTIPINPLPEMPANDFTRGQSFYDLHITPDPEDDEKLYVGGIDLHRSVDGGNTWNLITTWHSYYSNVYYNSTGIKLPVAHADQHIAVFNPKNKNHILFGNDGGIYFASNKNNIIGDFNSISTRNTRFNITQFYDGKLNPAATPENEFILAGAQDNGTQKLYGAERSNLFYQETEHYGGDGAENEFDDEGKYNIYSYVYNYHSIQNQQGEFDLISANDQNYGHFINVLTLDRKNDVFYSYFSGLTINKVSNLLFQNGSQNFVRSKLTIGTPLSYESISELTSSPYNTAESSLILAGTNLGRIFKIKNAHTNNPTYELLNTPITSSISSIRFGNTDNDILATVSNFNQISVYYSNDGGLTWINKEGNLPDIPVRTIFMNPDNNNEVILGTDLGVWGTSDFGSSAPNWSQYNDVIGNVRVTNFDYRPSTKTLLASTYGRGVFTTQLGTNPLSTSDVKFIENKFKIYPNPTRNPFFVEFDNTKYANVDLEIFDMTGKLVKSFTNVKNKENYLLSLPSGSYVVNFISNKTLIYTSKLLVK